MLAGSFHFQETVGRVYTTWSAGAILAIAHRTKNSRSHPHSCILHFTQGGRATVNSETYPTRAGSVVASYSYAVANLYFHLDNLGCSWELKFFGLISTHPPPFPPLTGLIMRSELGATLLLRPD